jgi:hypothetical protein
MAKTTNITEMPNTIEELQALLAKQQKELEAKDKELAKQQKAIEKANEAPAPVEDTKADLKRRVHVQLPVSSNNKEPMVVRVNDYICTIKRGVPVEVPYFVYLSIKESEDADAKTLTMIGELSSNFENASSQYRM